ncbi:endoplasmic reticulum transmembrane helix translocase-like [Littorina saxatilis]|uniref:Manganese-transporting ATPase 13A1 n=1 Tax=Littorina saxatilis TaxID=31220 RepID=A0AAN9G4J1_9CAEN
MAAPLNDEIQRLSYHNIRPVILHGYVLPFIFIYAGWFYTWTTVYGMDDYFEAGLIAFAIVGLLQILTALFCMWSIDVRCAMTCSKVDDPHKATWLKVVPTPNNGSTELIRLHRGNKEEGEELWFQFQKTKYLYDGDEKKQFVHVTFPIDHSVNFYMDWKGYQDDEEVAAAEKKFGINQMVMDIPRFAELFSERATAPFFVFQVFCVGLWCLDEYWYYSVFTLFMLIAFEATLVQQQLRNMAEIRKMGNKPYLIQVYRNRKWIKVMTDTLIPGDIVSITRSQDDKTLPCDMLLLRGPCIVDESMLTGESVPVMKEPVEQIEGDHILDIELDGKLHVLFGGTKVVQHTPPGKTGPGLKASDNGCIAYVLRHSFNTSQGKLLRTILFGVKRVTANNLETFFFIMFLLVFAIVAASYVWIKGTENPKRNRYKLFLECTLILTSVVPPELPIELSLAVNTSLLALTKLYVYCTEPFRIPFAGKIDICCFDKTGTLTSDNLVVEGVTGLGKGTEMIAAADAPLHTVQVLATCHSLVQLEDEMVGDPLEKATLKAVEWNLTKGEAVIPLKGRSHGLKIFHRYHFSSALKRMSVIVGHTPAGSTETHYMATVKGAPETLKDMFKHIPDNYEEVYLAMARRGARVLALGYKDIGALSHQQMRELVRDQVEKGLTFAGFVIISCPLKSDSKAAIKEILHSSHYVSMITGDNPLTACHVAKELRITRKETTLILSPPNRQDSDWHWQSIDDKTTEPLDEKNLRKNIFPKYDLCLIGEALTFLQSSNIKLLRLLLPNTRVFARVAPKQKELIITMLKAQGYITLMCGDGTNDVGALKHADVGVALLANAPERIPDRKKFRRDEAGSSVDAEPSSSNDKLTPITQRGKPTGRAAKQRAITRGDNMAPHQKKLAALLKEMEEEEKSQVIKLGDASVASPFTSKLSTVMSVCNIIKQGRCTLVTTLQMFKILALNALILAYSQSVLYLDGIKFSDGQATMQGLLLAGCFLFISRSKPLKTLSKERPLPNIFNMYTILTVMTQFAVHFSSLMYLVHHAKLHTPKPEGEFVDLEKEFEPNILNTTVYIISMSLQVSTFAVNYKGEPFMESLRENKPLLYSLMFSCCGIITLASGIIPDISQQFQIIELPSEFRNTVLLVVCGDILAAFLVDRTYQFLFGHAKLTSTH